MLVVLLNPLLKRLLHPRLPLQRGELAVAFFLILLANTLSSRGLPAQLLPVITGAYYYATPENDWAEIVQPYMPDWPVPQSRDAIWGFYEGDPTGSVPWAIWAAPLLYWAVFGLALFLAMVCLMVIVRRQWVERERLAYPMVQLPLAMIADDGRGRTIKPLFRSGFMWLGFSRALCPGLDQRLAQLLCGRPFSQHSPSTASRSFAAHGVPENVPESVDGGIFLLRAAKHRLGPESFFIS